MPKEETPMSSAASTNAMTSATLFNLPAPPGNVEGGEGNASFAWLEGSQYWDHQHDIPEAPSLRLDEDDFFFQLLRGSAKNTSDSKVVNTGEEQQREQQFRFFHAVPKLPDVRALEEAEHALEHSLANLPVPTHIRKMEIELVQRRLPRYPSQTHRKKASFYPLVHNEPSQTKSALKSTTRETKFLAFYRSRLQARRKRIAESQEKKRLRKERREKRRAAREAKRRLAKERQQSKKLNRNQASSSTPPSSAKNVAQTPPPPSPKQVSDVNGLVTTKNLVDDSGSVNEKHDMMSHSATDRIAPSTHDSSMISSVGSMGDDETFLDFELDDEDYLNTELEYFYSEEKQKMQHVHSRNIEDAERELRERRMEAMKGQPDEEENEYAGLQDTAPVSDRQLSLQDASPESLPPPEQYEPQVGVVSPTLQAMILQGQAETRNRKVPEEHKKLFKPTCMEASEVGRFTRLNEDVIEAYGTKAKVEKTQLPSVTWKQGQEQVLLPKTSNETASNTFTLFNEAAALGKIKALKPKIVTNYDPLSSQSKHHRDEYDIDDENKVKAMRTNYLTDVYIQDHLDHKKDDLWDGAELEEEARYETLDEVQLPTESCPTIKPATTKMSNSELMQAIGQGVAERAWERRYRLERPHAQQKIKRTCRCKFCDHANPFQTRAYRKKWLVQQGLWKEPNEEEEKAQPVEEEESALDNRYSVEEEVVDVDDVTEDLKANSEDDIVAQHPEIDTNTADGSEYPVDDLEQPLPQQPTEDENSVKTGDDPVNDSEPVDEVADKDCVYPTEIAEQETREEHVSANELINHGSDAISGDEGPEPRVVACTGGSYLDELLQRKSNPDVEEPPSEMPVAAGGGGGGYLDEILKRKNRVNEEPANEEPVVASSGSGGYLDQIIERKSNHNVENETETEEPVVVSGGGGYLDDIIKRRANRECGAK